MIRPDIAYVVILASQLLSAPRTSNRDAMSWILQYLKRVLTEDS